MPKSVLVPLDGSEMSERALPAAATLVRRSGAEAIVLTARWGGVVSEPHHYLAEAARAAGIASPETVVVADELAASAVVSLVEDHADPVVCLASHARGAVGQGFFGGVSEEILRRTDAPVVVVGPSARTGSAPLDELVVCIDGSELAAGVVPLVTAWAQEMALRVVVVGVVAPSSKHAPAVTEADLERVASALASSSVAAECRLLHSSHPAEALAVFAASRTGSWLVMTTHGRTGLARLTAGSVTMEVVRRATVPVLVQGSRYHLGPGT